MERWWVNGEPGRHLEVADRGVTYGDGLFETVALRAGRPRFLQHHLERLAQGCERLHIPAPDPSRLAAEVEQAVSGTNHGVLKILVTRGPGPRGYAPPERPSPTRIVGVTSTEPAAATPVVLRWCATMAAVNPATAGLKTLGRLDQVLARAEWSGSEFQEGLMLSAEGWVIGGTSSNLFLVVGEHVRTPSVDRAGVAGVMRRVVLDTARSGGIPVRVMDIAPALVAEASELFITNALTGIRPVRSLAARTWPVGPVTRRLQAALAALGVSECAA